MPRYSLLTETIDNLEDNGKSPSDVRWVGGSEFGWFTWEDFTEVANVTYDGGYGAQEVACDLMVVGDDWWLERAEYDGSEWWDFKQLPERPDPYRRPERVVGGMWDSLLALHEEDED